MSFVAAMNDNFNTSLAVSEFLQVFKYSNGCSSLAYLLYKAWIISKLNIAFGSDIKNNSPKLIVPIYFSFQALIYPFVFMMFLSISVAL